ncbi:hypothetical protein ABZ705_30545 [Streptomyces sp. NPDC006984]
MLLPGPWVFDLHDLPGRRLLEQLTARDCRIIELPRLPWRTAG